MREAGRMKDAITVPKNITGPGIAREGLVVDMMSLGNAPEQGRRFFCGVPLRPGLPELLVEVDDVLIGCSIERHLRRLTSQVEFLSGPACNREFYRVLLKVS